MPYPPLSISLCFSVCNYFSPPAPLFPHKNQKHSNPPSTTLDIYTHAFDKNKQAASRVLQEGLEI